MKRGAGIEDLESSYPGGAMTASVDLESDLESDLRSDLDSVVDGSLRADFMMG